jgi:1,4-dihydroxy-2-naphthoate octaprenyltransferase
MGLAGTRAFYLALVLLALGAVLAMAAVTTWWVLLGLVGLAMIAPAMVTVLSGAHGPALIPVLKATGMAELSYALGILVGVLVGRF